MMMIMRIKNSNYKDTKKQCSVLLYSSKIQAGFPSPADDYIEKPLDLNNYLISKPASTFFARVSGDSMIDACIRENDLLVVDKSIKATNGKIVVAVVDGEFTVKQLKITNRNKFYLMPANNNFRPMLMNSESYIWGVVTSVIHKV